MRYRYIAFLLFLLFTSAVQGQVPIGQWRCHLSYGSGITLAEVKNKIYCGTPTGMFYVNTDEFSVHGLCKVDGFADVTVQTLNYDPAHDILFIGYQSGDMDFLKGNDIIHHPDFLNSVMPGNKVVNSFYVNGNTCYIATSLGIITYRINKDEFGDGYYNIGPGGQQIGFNMVTIEGGYIYASSELGVQRARLSTFFLGSDTAWSRLSTVSCDNLVSFGGKVWGAFKGGKVSYWDGSAWTDFYTTTAGRTAALTLSHGKLLVTDDDKIILVNPDLTATNYTSNAQNLAIMDKDGYFWLGNNLYTLIRLTPSTGSLAFVAPNGPQSTFSDYMYNIKGDIWVAPGGINAQGAARFNNSGYYGFSQSQWSNFNENTVQGWPGLRDITSVVEDPITHHIWVASLDTGLAEIDYNKFLNLYSAANTNGALKPDFTQPSSKMNAPVFGLAMDTNANLWMTVYRSNSPLAVRTAAGKWYSFNLGDHKWGTRLVVDDYNQIWVINQPIDGYMYVYNYGTKIEDTRDDKVRLLGNGKGSGGLPSTTILSIAKDRDGQIWAGTSDGVAVFSDPSIMFNTQGYSYDAVKPWVKAESGYLLMTQGVTAIAVDGANRKWFGTKSGVFLTSDDGTRIIEHFTTDNSPLISNDIRSITVNGETGEVFFGTDRGIVSYRSTATEGGDKHENVYAYPNPVKPGYEGPIAISGLVRDAKVKITDVTGNLVYETVAQGGQAIWDGKNFSGDLAHSGVYLVFSTNADGSETAVTKILIVR